MKLFKKVLSIALIFCLMIMGLSYVKVSAQEKFIEVSFASANMSKSVSAYSGTFTIKDNNYTLNIENANNNNRGWSYIKMGSSKSTFVGKISTAASIDKPIKSLTLTIDKVTASAINSITVFRADNPSFTNSLESNMTIAAGDQTVTFIEPKVNQYYQIAVDCKKATSNGPIQISKVSFAYDEDSASPSILINKASASGTITVGSLVNLTTTNENLGEAPISWTSNNTSVATVDTNGAVTTLEYGDVTITASATVGGTLVSSSIDLVVYPSNQSPISIEKALWVCEKVGNTNSELTYTSVGFIQSTSGSSFTLTDSDSVSPKTIEVYVSLDGHFKVGNKVEVTGKLINYSNNTKEYYSKSTVKRINKVEFYSDEDSVHTISDVLDGEMISDPELPLVKDGYTFNGWLKGSDSWDFENDTVYGDIVLSASWIDSRFDYIADNISNVLAAMSLGYKYNGYNDATVSISVVESVADLADGDQVIIVSKANDGYYYAMSQSVTSSACTGVEVGLTIYDSVITGITGEFSNCLWTVDITEGQLGLQTSDGKYLSATSSGTTLSLKSTFASLSFVDITVVIKENTSTYHSFGVGTRGVFTNGSNFKNFANSNFNGGSYATESYIIKYSSSPKSSDFRIRCGVDSSILEETTNLGLEGAKCGIEVSTSSTTATFYSDDPLFMTTDTPQGSISYVVISLDDLLGHKERFDVKFTVKGFIEYNGNKYYTANENNKTYSVLDLINYYYTQEETKEQVTPLVGILASLGIKLEAE